MVAPVKVVDEELRFGMVCRLPVEDEGMEVACIVHLKALWRCWHMRPWQVSHGPWRLSIRHDAEHHAFAATHAPKQHDTRDELAIAVLMFVAPIGMLSTLAAAAAVDVLCIAAQAVEDMRASKVRCLPTVV